MIYPTSNSRESFFRQAPEKTFTPIEKKLSPLLLFKEDRFVEKFNLNTTQDGDPALIYVNGDYEVPYGTTLTPTNRCKGLYLIINGTLTINGTISMTARGANAAGKWIFWENDRISYNKNFDGISFKTLQIDKETISPKECITVHGHHGCGGAGGYCDWNFTQYGDNGGGNGTSFSGGAGSGMDGTGRSAASGKASPNGGKGAPARSCGGEQGTCSYKRGGAGAGNPGGDACSWVCFGKGSDGTGGLIIILAKNILVNSTGLISSLGSNGSGDYTVGNGPSGWTLQSRPGGGSGGGGINIVYSRKFREDGTFSTVGGFLGAGNGSIQKNFRPLLNLDSNFNFF